MFFLNLSLVQFLALFGTASALAVALYLLDRSRRREVVSTLRFWVAAEQPTEVVRRKHIQQPLSLILQLLGMLLLLLAMAELRFGSADAQARLHVIILETSAWMGAAAPGAGEPGRTLMDTARTRAYAYLKSIPSRDRVMLLRADGLATPATAFESDHALVRQAIADSRAGPTALNLEQALQFAGRLERSGKSKGEIAFIGSGRVIGGDAEIQNLPVNLRVLPVPDTVENCGLRKIGLRRSSADPALWEIYVSARNYGTLAKPVHVAIGFGGTSIGSQTVMLPAGADREFTFTHHTTAAGFLEVRLYPKDNFADDNRAVLALPALEVLPVTVYSDHPDSLRPFLVSNAHVSARFLTTAQYRPDNLGLVILHHFRPHQRPATDTIWIDPSPSDSPIPVRTTVRKPESVRWTPDRTLGDGLRTRDVRLDAATVFQTITGDTAIARIDSGPIIVARDTKPRMVVYGFDPAAMRYELAMPLLFGNILRWIAPSVFRVLDLNAQSAGTVNAVLDNAVTPSEIKVTREDGTPLPFTLRDRSLHFFSGEKGIVHVRAGERETVYSLTLPEMWESQWTAPASAPRGLPAFNESNAASRDLWQILAILGLGCLLFEFIFFGRFHRAVRRARAVARPILRKAS